VNRVRLALPWIGPLPTVRGGLLVLGAVELALLLAIPAPANPDKPGVVGGIETAAAQLRGEGPPVDLVQDYVGARSLVLGGDPYEVLTRAYRSVGLDWQAEHRSTHPPTAFVLVLPVAWLPWKVASAIWAALMVVSIGCAWWALGARWELAAALAPATLLWPPAAWSLGQLTPLWLLGVTLAWRWRDAPRRAGAAVAVAALTKLLPAVMLVPDLLRRRLSALAAFAATVGGALLVLVALRPEAVQRYVTVARSVGQDQAARGENAALLWSFGHTFGAGGVVVAVLVVGAVILRAIRESASPTGDREWSWWAWSWVAVALLPIAWIYSLLPLLPAIVFSLRRGGVASYALVAVPAVVPLLIDPFGLPGAIRLALATACVGLALLAVRGERREPARVEASPLQGQVD
jgi:Glycosyltransferase family 87